MSSAQKKHKNSPFRIRTQPTANQLLNEKIKYHRYDTSLYHKTNFHLKPLKDNPQLFTKIESSQIKQIFFSKHDRQQSQKKGKKNVKMAMMPQPISIRAELTRLSGLQKQIEKLLQEETVMLITAKKWIILDMETNSTIKGFKYKKEHDIASLTKMLTFYTAYMIIQKYYLSIDRLEMLVDAKDEAIQGTRIQLKNQYIVNLQDMLYAMMLESANNAATVIATNLGSLVKKKKEGKYFSCFDIVYEDKDQNLQIFLQLMNTYAIELGLKDSFFTNVHGMCKNKSTAKDMALLLSQCYKIPLFSKMVITKNHTGKAKYVSDKGQIKIKDLPLVNTNKLLWLNSGCIGGKTGCNSIGGQSLAACYEGGIIIVVLGSTGKQQKFADCQKLFNWLYKRLGC